MRPLFSAAQRRSLQTLAQAAMPAGARAPAPSAELPERVDRFLQSGTAVGARFIKAVLAFLEAASLLRYGTRLHKLDAAQARAFVEHCAHSKFAPLRLAFRAVISPLKIAHYAEPSVARVLGYDPPPETARAHPSKLQRATALPPRGRLRCEVAIIGSGAGGATIAKELAERGRDVVLLEEGGFIDRAQFTRRPMDMTALLYRDLGMTLALGSAGIPVPLGRGVGGTTTVNSGTCIRVPERVLLDWSAHDLTLNRRELAQDFARVEEFIEVEAVPQHLLGGSARVVQRGAAALGLRGAQPLRRNARHCQGSGVCCFGCPTDAKRSANVSWVPAALAAGARLVTDARVQRIDAGRVHRVLAGELEVHADAVVVSAGTLHTPGLLQRSGLRHPQLGRNISIHPACKASALFDEEIRGWEGVPQGLGIDDLHGEGILFEGIFLPPEFGAFALPFVGPRLTEVMEQYAHVAAFGFMVKDRSLGVLHNGQLLYEPGAPELAKLRRGVELLVQIFFAAGAREVYSPIAGFETLRGPHELPRLRAARLTPASFELSAFHPLGSCRASRDPARGVVDEGLEAHDVQRLFVVDGSVMPSSLGVNPQLTIMALAQRAARHVDARLSGAPRA